MDNFTALADVSDPSKLLAAAAECKAQPWSPEVGTGKTIGMLFFNPSLRTRMSTQKAAANLGMNTIVMNASSDGWVLEMEDGSVMDGAAQEHIKDAVHVMSQYCDVLAVRTFATLSDREADYQEAILSQFLRHAEVPVVSLESAIRHPLQSLADMLTIQEKGIKKPKIAVSWAPHPRALPQAVTNSFLEWSQLLDAEVVLTHPEGYDLHPEFAQHADKVTHDQEEAMAGADFVYVKNWSPYQQYGQVLPVDKNWTITEEKMGLTKQGNFMHCLPLRRNVVASDAVVDASVVYEQAKNRIFSAQAVLKTLLTENH
ncbi:MAG TPA: N-acetylornithine carbamoyltransferase [Cytophagales bacterium]|nr:N-acetylornithine carbamoyltransferase [Cytophagales bacterium]HAA18001.1 N-acetylornithine carbamoyltransferase [Cytophagales bacterium]